MSGGILASDPFAAFWKNFSGPNLRRVLRARAQSSARTGSTWRIFGSCWVFWDSDRISTGNPAMQIAKLRSGIFIALEQLMVHLQRAQNTLTRLGKSVADKHRSLQEALRERENALRNLLASSRVAIVVTNSDRRFVAANPKALDLFGISEKNLPKFTIDAFLPLGQILDFERNGPPFLRGEERRGRCNIRRLDGSLRIAEYTFVANFAPGRDLSSFREISLEKAQWNSLKNVRDTNHAVYERGTGPTPACPHW